MGSCQYTIPTKSGFVVICQTTTFRMENDYQQGFNVDFSVPMNIDGDVRIWTVNFKGKKVWSTNTIIQKLKIDKVKLFDFLAKITTRFNEESLDDIFAG